jgi:hypothetical protein
MTNTADTAKIPVYTSSILSDYALARVIDALRESFVLGHPDDQTPDTTWEDEGGTWSPGGVWSRFADPACFARIDHFQSILRFAYNTLGVRADGITSMSELTAAIRHECETTGALVDLPGIGLVQPSYATRHGLTPADRLS